jgi:hypothetical protein
MSRVALPRIGMTELYEYIDLYTYTCIRPMMYPCGVSGD